MLETSIMFASSIFIGKLHSLFMRYVAKRIILVNVIE